MWTFRPFARVLLVSSSGHCRVSSCKIELTRPHRPMPPARDATRLLPAGRSRDTVPRDAAHGAGEKTCELSRGTGAGRNQSKVAWMKRTPGTFSQSSDPHTSHGFIRMAPGVRKGKAFSHKPCHPRKPCDVFIRVSSRVEVGFS